MKKIDIKDKKYIALLSALFYSLSIPLSKIILNNNVSPVYLGAFTYLGAGIGFLIWNFILFFKKDVFFENSITIKELPYAILMVILDIGAIILLMIGLANTNSANASLLSNFEIAATSIIALLIFKEQISKKLWCAIILIIIASIILTTQDIGCMNFSFGSILVLLAYLCWGAENNCTRVLSNKNNQQVTIIKGIFSGLGSLIIAYILKHPVPNITYILAILLIGIVSYGLSVNMYIHSQKYLGAAKTAAYFSTAPFLGVFFALFILKEKPLFSFYPALLIMFLALFIISKDSK